MKDSMLENLLKTIADITGETDGAFNLRKDGVGDINGCNRKKSFT